MLCGALLLAWQELRSGGLLHPLFWHVAITTLLLAGPFVYTAINFGTLLRQRGMIYVCFVLLPLTIGRPTSSKFPVNAGHEEPQQMEHGRTRDRQSPGPTR